jgi:hypothetical protein
MQAFFFRRDFVELMRRDGKVFLSPFPDYYLANLAFGLARDVVVLPEPVSIAGVSRKSFGFTLDLLRKSDPGAPLEAARGEDSLTTERYDS